MYATDFVLQMINFVRSRHPFFVFLRHHPVGYPDRREKPVFMKNIPVIVFFSGLIWLVSCVNSPVEMVEHRNDQGQLERFERRKKDFAKEGVYQKFSAEGVLLEEAHYRNDTLEGERRYFYANGKPESVENYRNGIYHGPYRKFFENGTVQVEQEFVNGALEGISTAYYPSGVVKEKVMLRNNEENGPFTEYYENGVKKAEGTYIPGEELPLEQGELKEYDESGVLVRIADCQSGICQTRWKKE